MTIQNITPVNAVRNFRDGVEISYAEYKRLIALARRVVKHYEDGNQVTPVDLVAEANAVLAESGEFV